MAGRTCSAARMRARPGCPFPASHTVPANPRRAGVDEPCTFLMATIRTRDHDDGGVWKWNTATGEWTEISRRSPPPAPGSDLAMRRWRWTRTIRGWSSPARSSGRTAPAGRRTCFAASTGGKTWKPVFGGGGTFDYALAPYVARTPIHWLFDIEIDPANSITPCSLPDTAGGEDFQPDRHGFREAHQVERHGHGNRRDGGLELVSPTKGAHLISAIGDYGGFVHWESGQAQPGRQLRTAPVQQHQRRRLCREQAGGDGPRGQIFGAPSRRQHRVFVGWRQVVAASRVRTAGQCQPGSHRGFLGRQHVGLDATAEQCVLHARPRGHLDASPRHPRKHARDCRPRQSAEVLWAGPVDGKLFTSTDGAATFAEQALVAAGWAAENRGKPAATTAAAGPDLCHTREGGDLWLACVQRLVPFHRHPAGTLFEWVAPRSFTHSASAKPRQAPTTRRYT